MKNKSLMIILGILCALLIFETGYLIGNKERRKIYRVIANQPRPFWPEQNNRYSTWNISRELKNLQDRIDRINDEAERYWRPQGWNFPIQPLQEESRESYFSATLNSQDTEAANVITINLLGFNKEDIKIEVKGRYLIVQAARKQEASVDKKGMRGASVSAANFVQNVMLPKGVRPGQIHAEFNKGTLTITIPKTKQEARAQDTAVSIPIK